MQEAFHHLSFFVNLFLIYKVTILAILGQLVTSMIFSHYGILTQRIEPVNMVKLFGSLLTLIGAVLAV